MSVFVREIIDEEWGSYFELTGAGYGVLVAAMLAVLLICILASKVGFKAILRGMKREKANQHEGTGIFRYGNGAGDSDQYGQSSGYAYGRLRYPMQYVFYLPYRLSVRSAQRTFGGCGLRFFTACDRPSD